MNNDTDVLAEKLKKQILEIEEKAAKEIISSRGLAELQAESFIDSVAVSAILKSVDILVEGDNQ